MSYRKDDVTFHSDGFREGHAAVNVKVHGYPNAETVARVLADEGYILATRTDADELADVIAQDEGAWEVASYVGWEQAQAEAAEVFGAGYGVTSEGRSGGWCVVTYNGRETFDADDVAGWDAVALARWRKFEQVAREIADDFAYQATWSYIVNRLEPARADVASFALAGVGL